MKNIYFFVGTTAELIKLAPIVRELKKRRVAFKIIATNQNKLDFEGLAPVMGKLSSDYTFIMKPYSWPRNIYLRFVVWIVKSFGNYLIYFRNEFKNGRNKSSIFIVHGDTVTAAIGAMVAKLCGVKLVHVEAGLRSFNFLEPFPEEVNRFIISWLADVHFCPNEWAENNLAGRGGKKKNTFNNTLAESVRLALSSRRTLKVSAIKKTKYFILVVHRQEHTLFNREESKKIIKQMLAYAKPSLKCVFVMHKLTKDYLLKQKMYQRVVNDKNVIAVERLPFIEFIKLLKGSEFIATDGGSNQEEAYYLGKPCLILRNGTERIEGLGINAVLSGNRPETINGFVKNYKKYKKKRVAISRVPSRIVVDYLVNEA